jgi:hypothetical protein
LLKAQSEEALRAPAKIQRAGTDQEWSRQVEAWNQELLNSLQFVGIALQQHAKQWTTAQVLLGRLKELASPTVFAKGQAFLADLQENQALEMANLLLHMMANLPGMERWTRSLPS